jgi:hypothetical protein
MYCQWGGGACTIKLFAAVIFAVLSATISHVHPSLVFASKAGAYQGGAP